MNISRRALLGASAAGLAGTALSFPKIGMSGTGSSPQGRAPKNIIFMVADGMATQTLTMSDHFQQLELGHSSYWSSLINRDDVSTGLQDTRSLSSVVTDSSAASTAWGTGRRIFNGMVGMFPDKTELRTIVSLVREKGVKCGLVTTTTMTHATPSGFAINCVDRDLEGLIAELHLKSGVDILLGGGNKFFSADLRKDKRDLYDDFAKQGFKVVKNRKELLGLKGDKILGIFSDSHIPFSVDRNNSAEIAAKVPTLAEMTAVAIDNLKSNPKGFLLQVEGGRVDHAGHANDAAGLIYDQIAFEEAVKVAIEFAEKDKDTLVIITTDHACGGPSLNGAGLEYIESTAGLKSISKMKASYPMILEALGKKPTASDVSDVINSKLGIQLSKDEAAAISSTVAGDSPFKLSEFLGAPSATLGVILGNHSKIGWTSLNHSNDHVVVSAYVPWSEVVRGLTSNFEFYNLMTAAKGIKHENPTTTYEAAFKSYQKLKASIDPDLYTLYAAHDDCAHNSGF